MSGTVSAAPNEQHVSALAYGCAFTGAKSVTITMYNRMLFGLALHKVHVPATLTPNGGLRFEFLAPAAPIAIDYSVDGQDCQNGGGGLVVLPGYDRHVVVSMVPQLAVRDWHGRKFFAGTLPSFPVSVSVVATKANACPDDSMPEMAATIDGGAYYVAYVYGPHTFLKLRSSMFDTLYIRLPDASPVDSNSEYVRRDITEDDVRTLTTHGLNQEERCSVIPSGTAIRFP
jgi:hypothetical protein